MRIAFLSHKPHLNNLYSAISESSKVEKLFLYSRFLNIPQRFESTKVQLKPIIVRTFGVRFLMNRVLKKEFYSPNYVPRLSKILKKDQISHLVLFDISHWYTIQALKYKKQHPETSLYLWSETKEWPTSFFSRIFFKLFVTRIQKNQHLIEHVFVYTETGLKFMQEQFPNMSVKVISAPVDVLTFSPKKRDLIGNYSSLKILMNARYSSYKRHQDLFYAVKRLKEDGRHIKITLIGRADSGQERVEHLVKELGLEREVVFLNPLPMDKMPDLYHQHDVLVLPSYNEAIGMVVPEAMACGIPTITSDTVGANVYVKNRETGFIFETGNVDGLTAALERYCKDTDLLHRHGALAVTQIKENFSVDKIATQFLAALDERA
jgi:glycosyltransferase involved in cell wall biosynthesis